MHAWLCDCVREHIGFCHLRHPSLHVSGGLLFECVCTHFSMSVCVSACVFVGTMTGDDVPCTLLAASLSTVKVISLFSPLPAAATRDRLTNTNYLDGQSREREKKGGEEDEKTECEYVKIANRISAVKMNGDKSKRTHLKSEESSRGAIKATGFLKR